MLEEWQARPHEEGTASEQQVFLPGRPVELAGAESVTYRSSFADPRDPGDDVAVLELAGLYAHSEVDITGNLIGGDWPVTHDAYFRPLRIPFVPFEENDLSVTCHAPQDRFGGIHDTDLVPSTAAMPGIWWDVSLETHPLPYIDRIDVRPEVEDGTATLHLRTTVVAAEPLEERITYSVRPAGDHKTRGTMQRGAVETANPGVSTHEHTVEIRDPTLWWPHELGQQNQYTVRAKLGDTERTVTTGICSVTADDDGFRVNDEPLSIRGVNLVTADPTDIDRALDCNANLVRAHAQALPPAVYERCTEDGLLVWQDLPLTGPGEFDVERGKTVARTLVQEYGRHPSLAACTVHTDPLDLLGEGLSTGLLDRLRLRYRAWRSSYDQTAAEQVADTIPAQWPTFPVVGGPGVPGPVGSYYPGWTYGEPSDIESLLDQYPATVVAAFGAGALGAQRPDSGEEIAGFDAVIHDKHVDSGVEASQTYQAELIRTVGEFLRREQHGAIVFALRDTDEAGMGVYTDDGREKQAAAVLRETYEPVRAFLAEPTAPESEVVVVNDRPHGSSGTLRWETGTDSGERELTVGPQGRWQGDPIELPETSEVRLELELADETYTTVYER